MTLRRLARAPLLHQSVQEGLKEYVIENSFKPGDPLPAEAELARQLGVSRISVREAVKALEIIGILESRRGSSVYVGALSFDPLLESLTYGLMLDSTAIVDLLDLRCAIAAAVDRLGHWQRSCAEAGLSDDIAEIIKAELVGLGILSP